MIGLTMLKNFRPSKRTALLLGLLVVLLVGLIFVIRSRIPPTEKIAGPKIVKIAPENGSENVSVIAPVEITFEGTINEDSVACILDPNIEIVKTVSANLQTLFLSPLPSFEPGTEYAVTITKVLGGSQSFSFKTSEQLTESEKTALQTDYDVKFNEAADEYERTHPLLERLPVEEVLFKIEYKGNGLYEYTLKGSDRNRAKEAMLNWWRKNGVDPNGLNLKESGL